MCSDPGLMYAEHIILLNKKSMKHTLKVHWQYIYVNWKRDQFGWIVS